LHQTSNLHETPYALRSEQASSELIFYSRFLDLCETTAVHGKIVGCGAGEFLKLSADRGFDVAGIEPIGELREVAEQTLSSKCIESRPVEEAKFEDECFNAIVMWDVIEHLIDPRGTLAWLHRLLRPGGYLGIATLHHGSIMYAIYHVLRWTLPPLAPHFGSMLYNPFHTYYFTKKSLARLVQNAGFEIIEHRGYEFPINRLDVGSALKFGMRCLYVLQWACRMQGEQYVFARKP
jgi:2-polyprenyl-3-methyl-5-hydroxy-6-metoxy-1,4-benzoquinol methylase